MVTLVRCLSCLLLLASGVAGARIARRRAHGGFDSTAGCGVRRGSPGPTTNDVNMSIIGGRPAPECAWPWQVYQTGGGGNCGGTLITPQWVLSAQHCSTPGVVYAGIHNRSMPITGGQKRMVAERINHPNRARDIMLLKLDKPFELSECVNFACLPTRLPQVGETNFWITGWGTGPTFHETPDILQETDVTVRESRYPLKVVVGREGNGACYGDSGGPLVHEENGRWTLYGATSGGTPNCDSTSRYESVYDHMDWIMSSIGLTPAPTPAPAPGTWVVEGSGCQIDGDCISSSNHPSNYGNREECSINLYGDVTISVDAFNTERCCDKLTVGGSSYSGSSGPPSGSYSGVISWSSDFSATKSGWKLCKA